MLSPLCLELEFDLSFVLNKPTIDADYFDFVNADVWVE